MFNKIIKQKMYKIEIHTTFHQIMAVFYQLGIWQDKSESAIRRLTWKLFYLFHFILLQITVVTCGFLSDDKNNFLFCVEVEVGLSVLTIKLVYLLWKKNEIQSLLNGFLIGHSIEKLDEYVDINKKVEKFMKFIHLYTFGLFGTALILSVVTLPIFSSEKTLPIVFTLPFDSERNEMIYWMSYAYLTFELFFLAVLSLFPVIIWSIERFKLFFSHLFLAQVATSGICLCISTYALAFNSHEKLMESATYVSCILYAIFDIFLVMYLGNEIMLASDRLSYCLFESNWMAVTSSRKCVVILFEVLKRPQKLLIFKLFPINLETFTLIIDFTYSMFNILKSINGN